MLLKIVFIVLFSTVLGLKLFKDVKDSSLIVRSEAPQQCNEITAYFDLRAIFSIFITLNIKPFYVQEKQYISIEKINITSEYYTIGSICALLDTTEAKCISDFSSTLSFEVESTETFSVEINVKDDFREPYDFLLLQVFDEGSFSYFTGAVYSNANQCYSSPDSPGSTDANFTQCCTSLAPAPTASINFARCLNFKSRTTVYNINDNYSIFLTSKINYTIGEENITSHGELTGPKNYTVIRYEISTFQCNFPIPNGDSKLLLQMEASNKTEEKYEPTILVGRLIIRNGQTLMEEGISFTKENDCQYFNRKYTKNQVATTSFCCTQFQE